MIVHMIGNAHIDPVWQWPWQVGVDEALATFRSAADRCDEYPEFIVTRGESWLYQQVERLDPVLFARVRAQVARGQWHITGGQYLQPDTNLPTAMGLRRQFEHGRRYFEDRFGQRPTVAFNVDTFGHPATLPDLLASLGYTGYVFHRPAPHQVELPAPAFIWRGPDGGEVIGFRIIPAYVTRTDDLYGQIMLAIEAADPRLDHTMCFYGVGNHGGGPTKASIEYIRDHAEAFPGLELRFSTPQAFFEAIDPLRDLLPVVTTELQHTFPGCYSVMHDVKQRQHHGEHLLDQAERVVATLAEEGSRAGLQARLDAAWDDLLFTQFHDILAGTAVASAWEGVAALQGRARIAGEEVVLEATRRWARRALRSIDEHQIVVINPDPAPWQGLVEMEPFLDFAAWGGRWISDAQGVPLPYQQVLAEGPEMMTRIIFPLRVAAGEGAYVLVRDAPAPAPSALPSDLRASPHHLTNSRLRVDLTPGGIGGLWLDGQPLLGEGGIGLHLRHDSTDTWTFHADRFAEPVAVAFAGEGWLVEEAGPLRARVHTEGWVNHSWVRWTLSLAAGEPRLEMDLEVAFVERYTLLQLPIYLGAVPARWTDGQPGGHVERQPGPVEWPVHGWSRVEVLGTPVALLTPDAYSLSLDGACWQWTLLRSPKMAWGGAPPAPAERARHTDQGYHTFRLALAPGGALPPEELETAARQQAQPPIVFDRYEGMNRPPWGNHPPRNLWTGAEQRALADGRMAHLME